MRPSSTRVVDWHCRRVEKWIAVHGAGVRSGPAHPVLPGRLGCVGRRAGRSPAEMQNVRPGVDMRSPSRRYGECRRPSLAGKTARRPAIVGRGEDNGRQHPSDLTATDSASTSGCVRNPMATSGEGSGEGQARAPRTTGGFFELSTPPLSSSVIASRLKSASAANTVNPGSGPNSPSEISCSPTLPHSW